MDVIKKMPKLSVDTHRTTVFIPVDIKEKLPANVNLSGLIRDLLIEHAEGSSEWQKGFTELYTFFKEVMQDPSIIKNITKWNELLNKRNLNLISALGGKL